MFSSPLTLKPSSISPCLCRTFIFCIVLVVTFDFIHVSKSFSLSSLNARHHFLTYSSTIHGSSNIPRYVFSADQLASIPQSSPQNPVSSSENTDVKSMNQNNAPYYMSSIANNPNASVQRITLRRYLNSVVKEHPELRDMESLSLSIQMACKTISSLVNRNGIKNDLTSNTRETSPTSSQSSSTSHPITNDMRLNSMKRLDLLSTNVLRNALRFTGKLQMVMPAALDDEYDDHQHYYYNDDSFALSSIASSSHVTNAVNPTTSTDNKRYTNSPDISTDNDTDDNEGGHQPGVLIASAIDSKYVAYFDPLDGSGNADAGICTGTVFGIFETRNNDTDFDEDDEEGVDNVVVGGGDGISSSQVKNNKMVNAVLQPGKNLRAAGYCLYSSATILVFTLGEGTHGFTLDPQINEFVLTHPNIRIPPRGNVYSCNEANSEGWSDDLKRYVRALKMGENETKERYALRYIGSMVGDIHRTLMYGGIFFYPKDSLQHPNGNLQLLYKCAPMSYVIEQAGGKCTNGRRRLLDVQPKRVHERSPCFIGSPEDIDEMKTYVLHKE